MHFTIKFATFCLKKVNTSFKKLYFVNEFNIHGVINHFLDTKKNTIFKNLLGSNLQQM
jgi:hypothetical protein